jgi:hypothetical protein
MLSSAFQIELRCSMFDVYVVEERTSHLKTYGLNPFNDESWVYRSASYKLCTYELQGKYRKSMNSIYHRYKNLSTIVINYTAILLKLFWIWCANLLCLIFFKVVGTLIKWAGSCRQKKRIKDKDALSHAGAAIPRLEFVSKVLVRSVTIHKYTPLGWAPVFCSQ